MATATAPAPMTPCEGRDEDTTLAQYRDGPAIAAGIAWDLVVHDPGLGPDLARVRPIELPHGADHEDMAYFLWELVGDAARAGYLVAKLDLSALDAQTITSADLSRAVAALLGRETVEDGATFDPESRRDAAS